MATPAEYFAQVINDYRQNYAFNHVENVNWDNVYSENVSKYTPNMSQYDFAKTLTESLRFLHNEHWQVTLPNGQSFGAWPYDGKLNFIRNPQTWEVDTDLLHNKYFINMTSDTYGVNWGITKENVGYICLKTQVGNDQNLNANIINSIFDDLKNTSGLIFDIRSDEGGNNLVGDKFLNYFSNKDILYGYFEDKPNNTSLPLIFHDNNSFFDKPIISLIGNTVASSGELLAYALKELDNATLIGDTTFGPDALLMGWINNDTFYSSIRTLDNGIKYTIPSRYAQLTVDGQYAKYNPVKPDLSISPNVSYDTDSDFVVEKSIGTILEKTDSNVYYKFIDINTNTNLITHSAVEMVSAKYNMPNYQLTGTSNTLDTTGHMGSWNIDFMKGVYFDESYYLKQKSNQLNSLAINGKTDWTENSTFEAIQNAGMTPWEHFSKFGAFEKSADNTFGINPSSFFDISNYYSDKVAQCQSSGQTYTSEEIVQAFQTVGIDPIVHYSLYGFLEDITPSC